MSTTKIHDLITINTQLDTTLVIYDKIINSITDGNFFEMLMYGNKDIISNFYKSSDGEIVTFVVDDLLGENNEKSGVFCFTRESKISNDSVMLEMHKSSNYKDNEINISKDNVLLVNFDWFTIEISPDNLTFNMKYDQNEKSPYPINVVEELFKKIFDNFYTSLSDPLFLLRY